MSDKNDDTKSKKSDDRKPPDVPFPDHEIGKSIPKDPVIITVNRYSGPR